MSTQINVTVGSGGLIDKARQLQTAARQAQLEKERQQRLEVQGTEQRTAKLEAEGRAADGSPLYSPSFRQPEIERRPAANRQQTFNYGQGYFTVTRGTNDIAVITVRSGDKATSTTIQLAGSEKPAGFRERAGVDKLPPLTPPSGTVINQDTYFYTTAEGSDYVYGSGGALVSYTRTQRLGSHGGVKRNNDDSLTTTIAHGASTGGWAQFFSGYFSHLTVLPVGKDVAIFAYLESRKSYKTYSLQEEVLVERLYGSFPPPTEVLSYSYSFAEQITEKQSNIIKAAFVISKGSVRQITYPESLYTKLLSSKRYREFNLSGESLAVPTVSYYIFFPPATGLTAYGTWFSFNVEPEPANLGYTQHLMSYWGEALQYTASNRASPGEYSAIQDSITPLISPASYAYIKSLLPSVGQNFKWFRVNEDIDPDELQRYKGELPEYYNDPFDETAFTRVKSVTYEQQPGESYYRWTDWDNPGYCRTQALALGFTTADLTP
jgi:hypothetical protein